MNAAETVRDARRALPGVLAGLRGDLEGRLLARCEHALPLAYPSTEEERELLEVTGLGFTLGGQRLWCARKEAIGGARTVEDVFPVAGGDPGEWWALLDEFAMLVELGRLARQVTIRDGVRLSADIADLAAGPLGLDPAEARIVLAPGDVDTVAAALAEFYRAHGWAGEPSETPGDELGTVPVAAEAVPSVADRLDAIEAAWELERRAANREAKRLGRPKVPHRCDAAFRATARELEAVTR